MSWAQCNSGSNNIHFNYPPLMSDGRNFSSWRPGSEINEQIKKDNNITSSFDYRKFMVENADKIITQNQVNSCDSCGYCPLDGSCENQSTPSSPFLYTSCLETSQPYGYNNSDLKTMYLSRQQLQSRLVAPILTQDQYLKQGYPNAN
jgi:hypothetical protein